ncbi:N-acetylglucosamine kinase [Paenibacillaceae bacterium WGS1546]|uniref:N-acetylglucosamine kinase n=1 Tax=Cohnella sp. WGS1546 TaxID=3366810 RepID=UPI00372D4136
MKYAAGLDGGGTKTAVTIVDGQGREIRSFVSGAINYNGQDEESVRRSLEEIFRTIGEACRGLANCARVCIAAAGVSNPSVAPKLTSLARSCGYAGELTIVGDQEAALVGAHEGASGIILIAGTGSICYGRNEAGETHRAGGCGYLIDDEGSGYSIGRDLLAAVVRMHDGRLPPTAIAPLVYERLKTDSVRELIAFVHHRNTNKRDIAALASLLSDACDAGDAAALAIARRSAESLRELVLPVANKLILRRGSLALAGSVLLRNRYVREELLTLLRLDLPELNVYPARKDAAWGAVRIALGDQ